jgi:hypothetical protein
MAWTSDSKAVLFVSNRNGTRKLFKQNIDETMAEVLVEGRSIFLPRLSSDGSQVLYLSYPNPANTSLPVALMSKSLAGRASSGCSTGKRDLQLPVCSGSLTIVHLQQNRGSESHLGFFRSRTRCRSRDHKDNQFHGSELGHISGRADAGSVPQRASNQIPFTGHRSGSRCQRKALAGLQW